MKNKIIIFLCVFLIVLPVAFGSSNLDIPLPTVLDQSYGTFELNKPIFLIQTCTNLTDFCDNCSLTSIKYPDGTALIVPTLMQKTESLFNYTLADIFIIKTGKYTVTGHCIGGGIYSPWAYNFEVTESGLNEDNLDTTSGLVVFLFVAMINLTVFALPSLVKKFTNNPVVDELIRRLFYLLGIVLFMFNTAIVVTIADGANLGLDQELFRYMKIAGFLVYPFAIFIIWNFLLKILNYWKGKKEKKRMGEDEEDEYQT